MKETELMIGDWVKINYRGKFVKVTAIHDGLIDTTAISPLMEDEYEPIPLTAEILEKNGWSEDAQHFPEDENFDLELEVQGSEVWWTINLNEYDIIRLSYVHELQHALRLCGIEKEIIL